MESDNPIRQEISIKEAEILSISIKVGTYESTNEGTLTLTLYEDDNVIQQWTRDTSLLVDNEYAVFELDAPYLSNPDHRYSFTIVDHYSESNAIALYDSQDNSEETVCYKVNYTNRSYQRTVVMISVTVFLALVILIIKKTNEKILMIFVVLSLGLAYFFVCPLGIAPDEQTHFWRAYEISHGHMVSQHVYDDGIGGNTLPSAVKNFNDESSIIDWNNTEVIEFGNTSLYAPVNYLPQSIGITIAELFTQRVSLVFYAGRACSFLLCMTLCILSIWIIPFGRKILFMIMLFPMSLQEMISMSPDGLTISLSLFLISYILYVSYSPSKLRKRDYIIITATCLLLSLMKIVYVVLLFLVLIIPKDKFNKQRNSAIFKTGLVASAFVLNLIWLTVSSGFLGEFQPGVNSSEQVKYILLNLPDYLIIVIRTTLEEGLFIISTMIGSNMGRLTISTTGIIWVVYLIMFVYTVATDNESINYHKQDAPIMLLVFFTCVALIYTSLYVQWTALKNEIVRGIQGRYFTPVLPLPALVASRLTKGTATSHTSCYYFVLLLFLNGVILLDIINYTFLM
ncbi:MAG: DUF2142 domain-containing protein [Saccharofermentans sp.]|nr:DUF2142 domain-containing protein [Saccharofermentans sp.]